MPNKLDMTSDRSSEESQLDMQVSKGASTALSSEPITDNATKRKARPVLAEFAINPTGSAHMSKDVAKVIEILEGMNLDYRLGPMGTAVEGGLDQILLAIQQCHAAISANHERVITNIMIDDRREKPHQLDEMVSAVEHHLGWKAR